MTKISDLSKSFSGQDCLGSSGLGYRKRGSRSLIGSSGAGKSTLSS